MGKREIVLDEVTDVIADEAREGFAVPVARAIVNKPVPEALKPLPARIPRADFVKEARFYPREVYRDDYYQVIHSADTHYDALFDGWVDDKDRGKTYRPITSSPESLALAATQLKEAEAKKQAEAALRAEKVVKASDVDALIAKALAARGIV